MACSLFNPFGRWLLRPAVMAAYGLMISLMGFGCGTPKCTVSGKVTYKGTPVEQADLLFEPQEGGSLSISGRSGTDGVYYLNYLDPRGMPTGTYRVLITHYTLPKGKALPAGEAGAALRNDNEKVIRQNYEFFIHLQAGPNQQNFELTEGKRIPLDPR
ncbi:MAG: carboxypeptidase-like regulatory domain-containing protein [Gemmataceae bacterium]|nr:carboxypeptidase-like regulatory domain-containing protein [Gemmataceae bacterium]MDW8243159.1 carboxypeptidase-like regulatory domain-containing protein [Thermogemmata sp.]